MSVEQIRQRAAGSLVEQHAHGCHGGALEERSHPSLLFVKALSHRERLMTALLNLWMEHPGGSGLSPEVKAEVCKRTGFFSKVV